MNDSNSTSIARNVKEVETMQAKKDEDRKKIAVFIDIQNMNENTRFDALFSKLETSGTVELKMAYAEWKDVGPMIRKNMLRQHVKQIQTSRLASSGKNGADMQIVIDVMNTLYQREDVDTFVIVAGDTDYVPLINEIASRGKRCVVAAHDKKMGDSVKECCHEFISLDDLLAETTANALIESPVPAMPVKPLPTVASLSPEIRPVRKSYLTEAKDARKSPVENVPAKQSETKKSVPQKDTVKKKKARGVGVTIENDQKSLTLFPDQWLNVLDEMEKCCCFGPIDFTELRDYVEKLFDSGQVTFSKSIIVPVLNTYIAQGLFDQPSRGRIVIADNFEQKRQQFVRDYHLE